MAVSYVTIKTVCYIVTQQAAATASSQEEMSSSDSDNDEPCPEALARYLNIRRNTVSLGDPRQTPPGGGVGGALVNPLGADMHTPPPTFMPHPQGGGAFPPEVNLLHMLHGVGGGGTADAMTSQQQALYAGTLPHQQLHGDAQDASDDDDTMNEHLLQPPHLMGSGM